MPRGRSAVIVASPAAAAETAICTVGALTLGVQDVVDIEGSVDITIGASGTAVTLKVERGAVAGGAIVATFGPFTVVAGNRYNLGINCFDVQQTEQQGQAYVLTATVTAGAAQSTVNAVWLGVLY